MDGDWKCPECPYNSQSEAQLEKHMKTIAHRGIQVKSETVKEVVSKHSEPEKTENKQDSNPQHITKGKLEDSESDIVQNGTRRKVKAKKNKQSINK